MSMHTDPNSNDHGADSRRGFTLIEVLVALIITAFILGAIWTGVGRMVDARTTSRARMAAFMRADNALNTIRQAVASTLRSDDLFWTKFRIFDDVGSYEGQLVPRDDLLVFYSQLRMERPLTDQGEGIEYEVQYRIESDAQGSVLWQRRDPVTDDTYDGGGVVTPIIDQVVGFNVEATDGDQWFSFWESDEQGLPRAVRITVLVAIEDQPDTEPVRLETVIAIDRVPPPFDAEGVDDDETGASGGSGGATGAAGDAGGTGTGGTGTGGGGGPGAGGGAGGGGGRGGLGGGGGGGGNRGGGGGGPR